MTQIAQISPASESHRYAYHLLRIALERFNKSVGDLDEEEYKNALRQARKSHAIESLVLDSEEALNVVVSAEQVAESVSEIESRFDGRESYLQSLKDNNLDEETLANAVYREKMFDVVMRKVSSRAAGVSDLDVQIYYHMHPDKFHSPEMRRARHILITINPDYPENRRDKALQRIQNVLAELQVNPDNFDKIAHRHSECPSALQGGELGYLKPGQLYPELDEILFQMDEGGLSGILETETGFHILLCEEIRTAYTVPFEKAKTGIRDYLEERQQKNCQKAWLNKLREESNA